MNVIEAKAINKSFKDKKILENISFNVKQGEIFGIIGPDEAGKSTLFRILTTLLLPSSGAAKVLGLDLVKDYAQIRSQIGYMPGTFSLYYRS